MPQKAGLSIDWCCLTRYVSHLIRAFAFWFLWTITGYPIGTGSCLLYPYSNSNWRASHTEGLHWRHWLQDICLVIHRNRSMVCFWRFRSGCFSTSLPSGPNNVNQNESFNCQENSDGRNVFPTHHFLASHHENDIFWQMGGHGNIPGMYWPKFGSSWHQILISKQWTPHWDDKVRESFFHIPSLVRPKRYHCWIWHLCQNHLWALATWQGISTQRNNY